MHLALKCLMPLALRNVTFAHPMSRVYIPDLHDILGGGYRYLSV